jgi:DtxR family Mn-dependent transcriptional regulator
MNLKLSFTEENYLKAIHSLTGKKKGVNTNSIAEKLSTKASSVTDMIKKLAEKKLVKYEPYQGVKLTKEGEKIAVSTIRKHRLWEVFLVEKLKFGWEEVHEMAEQLEHIHSIELIDRLDAFLDHPKVDPHGDPIPDKDGNIQLMPENILVGDCKVGEKGKITGVNDISSDFLIYLNQHELTLGASIKISQIFEFDQSFEIEINKKKKITVSQLVTKNIYIRKS